ncbi:uncharacterized protein [Physcomitrium patens]|uniref:O-acyltransferase WSD1 C-terminal domain-containing protein n=1 Tax=Physcomitrium patens TaxID=3218 RepID=A0A2K1ING6_PHYPA|nr:uncharacterized protein LOC112274874 [Physcomitrium patens]XP_024360467.1 uncharacterized protein LOC112274874 [Physcomitrium patens]XP_024360469.1 uncharacterized protein LOC112274874 [Physcomitrium patens]XP_024360470.1 uncharacterized protein LOC112274874 [Physcomitrium patens]PNR30821.1 hypothetical protein PHYPA_027137 [Physcomitrium patens]|eukprot:XP_024360466.1 uncharacterized protein LOC112274874 [Physcomitrella patens]
MAPVVVSGDDNTRVLGPSEYNWTKATALGTGIAVVAVALRRLVKSHQVALACQEVMDQHATLRAQVVETPKGKLAFHIKGNSIAPNVEIYPWPQTSESYSVGDITVDGDDDGLAAAVNKVVRDELNTPFVIPEDSPSPPLNLFQVHMYTESFQSQTIIVLRFHSGGLDRPSASVALDQFLTALNSIVDGQPVSLPHNPGKDAILPTIEELVPKGKSSKNFFQKGFDTVGYALSANRYSLLPFHPNFAEHRKEKFKSDVLTYSLGKAGTASLLAACKKENTTLAAALGTAFLKTAAGVKELKDRKKDEFSFTSLVDCRRFFEPSLAVDAMGNFVAGVPQGQQAKEGCSFWDLARTVSALTAKELSKSKHLSEIPVPNMLFSQVLKHPNVTPQSSMRTSLFSLFVDEAPKLQWRGYQNLQVGVVAGPFPSMHGVGPCFAISETLREGNDLSISFIYAQPVFTRSQMSAYCAAAVELLSQVSLDC